MIFLCFDFCNYWALLSAQKGRQIKYIKYDRQGRPCCFLSQSGKKNILHIPRFPTVLRRWFLRALIGSLWHLGELCSSRSNDTLVLVLARQRKPLLIICVQFGQYVLWPGENWVRKCGGHCFIVNRYYIPFTRYTVVLCCVTNLWRPFPSGTFWIEVLLTRSLILPSRPASFTLMEALS